MGPTQGLREAGAGARAMAAGLLGLSIALIAMPAGAVGGGPTGAALPPQPGAGTQRR